MIVYIPRAILNFSDHDTIESKTVKHIFQNSCCSSALVSRFFSFGEIMARIHVKKQERSLLQLVPDIDMVFGISISTDF